MKEDKILYDIYCRKSQEDEDRQVLSLEAQEKACRDHAAKNVLKICNVHLESFTAKAPGRKIFNSLMQDIYDGQIQGIIAWHPDRLSRNSVDAGLIIYYLDTGQIKDLAFPTYRFEDTPQGKWMLNIQFTQSKYYVDALSENVMRGNKTKREHGWRPSMAPAGYINDKVEKTILADPERFPILQRGFKDIIYGRLTVLEALDKINNEWGYKSLKFKKRGGLPLSRSSIYHLLTNPFYCGIIVYKKGSEYKEYPGKHPKMIEEGEFDKLQVILGRKGKPRPQKHSFPLTGAIRCGECGSMITAETKTKHYPGTNNTVIYTYYRCTKKNKNIDCKQVYIRDDIIEGQIDEYLENITIEENFKDWALKYLDYVNQHEAKTEELSFANVHNLQEDTRKELRNLTQLRIREQIDDQMFEDEKARITKEIKRLDELLKETNRRADQWFELSEETFNFAYYARMHFANGDILKKKEIFAKLGSNFVLTNKFLGLDLKEEYLAFTPEYKKKLEALEPDKQRLITLQNAGLAPHDPSWLGD